MGVRMVGVALDQTDVRVFMDLLVHSVKEVSGKTIKYYPFCFSPRFSCGQFPPWFKSPFPKYTIAPKRGSLHNSLKTTWTCQYHFLSFLSLVFLVHLYSISSSPEACQKGQLWFFFYWLTQLMDGHLLEVSSENGVKNVSTAIAHRFSRTV